MYHMLKNPIRETKQSLLEAWDVLFLGFFNLVEH